MGQINTNNYPTVDSLADADLLIVENATNGTGTTTPKQLRENAIGTDPLQTTAQTVTEAINELKDRIDAGAGVVCYDVDSVTQGRLGSYSGDVKYLLIHFDTDAEPYSGVYSLILSYSGSVVVTKYGALYDRVMGMEYDREIYSGSTLLCEIMDEGTGTQADPVHVDVLGVIDGYVTAGWGRQAALGERATAEGIGTEASGNYAHAQGSQTTASGNQSTAMGYSTTASADGATAMGNGSTASGVNSIAGGYNTQASGAVSTAIGTNTQATQQAQLATGKYNKTNNDALVMVGNGTGASARSNALEVLLNGDVVAGNEIIDGQGNTLSVLAEALTKTASGNPVVITDCAGGKARSLITEINAIQDLHGYDKPWVGGADRNLLPDSYTAQSASVFGLTITKVDNGLRFVGTPNWNTQISQFRAASSSDIATLYADGASPACFLKASNQYINIDSCRVDGNDIIVVANTTATTMNVDFTLEFMMYKGTAPTAFRPYSNICPISGRTAVAVERTGQNLWDENYAGIAQSIKYTPIYVGDGSFTLRTTAPRWDNSGCAVFLLAGNVSSGATNADHGAYNGSPRTQTAVNGYVTVAYRIVGDIDPRNYDTELIKTSEITNATIQLGQTVYGADINWDTGVMTVKTAVVDMGSLEWFRTNTHRFQSTGLNGLIYPNSDNVIPPDMKCEIYKPFAAYQTSTTDFGITAFHITSDNTTYLRALDANIDDLTAFMAQIDSKKLEYKLATPTTIQLTPEQLEMLKGYNRVTIDNGSIELGYIAKLT
jgi:hypothetical protein